LLTEFRVFETDQFQEDLNKLFGARKGKIVDKLSRYVYPQIRKQPYFGKNIKKLKGYAPETWRYRIGAYRFFYEVDGERKIVFMLAASLRAKSY
jgi:mRNA interferase RelE/StbE